MRYSIEQKAILALIIANIIWGAGAPLFKWSLEIMQPFTLAFLRFSIASLILLPFVLDKLKIEKKDYLHVGLHALLGITFNISFFFLGLQFSSSINAPIIASAGPIFLILGSMFLLKERLKPRVLAGTLLGLFGVLVIVVRPLFESGLSFSFIGNLFFILATLGQVGHALLLKKIGNNYHAITLTFWSFVIGSLCFFPLFVNEVYHVGLIEQIGIQSIVGVIFGVIFSSTLAYLLFNWGVQYLQASEVGIFVYIDPLASIIIAYPLLHEIPTPTYLLGALFVFAGIFIAENRLQYHPLAHLFKQTQSIPQ